MRVLLVFAGLLAATYGQSREERLRDNRLPGDLFPTLYELELQPELTNDSGRLFDAPGRVRIHFDVRTPTDVIMLNVVDFTVEQPNVQLELDPDSDVRPPVPAISAVSQNSTTEFLFVNLSRNLEVGAKLILTIQYTLELDFIPAGIYLIPYANSFILTSVFKPSNARQAFPCFDEPEYKARFQVNILRKADYSTVSCMNIDRQEGRPGGWIADIYQETPRISTQSMSINVLDFVYREAVSANGTVIRLWGRAGRIPETDLVTTLAPRLVDWYEIYTGVKFPLQKIDHIPLLRGGLVDALGVLMYPQRALYFRDDFDSGDIAQQAAVIAQQTAQQWFGHYITPVWWSEVWVSEALVTYFSYRPLENILRWNASQLEWFFTQSLALRSDALNNSVPVRLQVRTPRTSILALNQQTYTKGASTARMIAQAITQPTFDRALRNLLVNNAWSTIDTNEFWNELQQQVDRDNIRLPDGNRLVLADRFDPWIGQQHYPLITVNRQPDGSAELTQSIFLNPANQTIRFSSPWNYRWNVPITFFHAGLPAKDTRTDVWMEREDVVRTSAGLPPAGQYVVANVDRLGFYRVDYDNATRQQILTDLNTGNSKIPIESKAQLLEDSFELTMARFEVETTAMEFTKFLKAENEFLPWITQDLYTAYMDSQFSRKNWFNFYSTYWRGQVDPVYALSGNDRPDADREIRVTKRLLGMQLTQTACAYGNPDCVSRARTTFDAWRNSTEFPKPDIRADIALSTKCTTIANGNDADWTYLSENPGNFGRAFRRSLVALACTQSTPTMQSYWDRTIGGEFPANALFFIAVTDIGRDIAWPWLKANWDDAAIAGNRRYNLMFLIATRMYTQEEIDDLRAHQARHPPQTGTARALYTASLQTALFNQGWHSINSEPLRAWLEANQPRIPPPVSHTAGRASGGSVMGLYHLFQKMQMAQGSRDVDDWDPYLALAQYFDSDEKWGGK